MTHWNFGQKYGSGDKILVIETKLFKKIKFISTVAHIETYILANPR